MIEIKKPNFFQNLIKKFVKTRIGTAVMRRILHHLDRFTFKLTKEKHTMASILSGLPTIILQCRGAKTGRTINTPLIGIPIDDNIGIIASNWGQQRNPNWYYNIKANPDVIIKYKKQEAKYNAIEIDGLDRDKYWKIANEMYPGYKRYAEIAHRAIPVIKLSPVQ